MGCQAQQASRFQEHLPPRPLTGGAGVSSPASGAHLLARLAARQHHPPATRCRPSQRREDAPGAAQHDALIPDSHSCLPLGPCPSPQPARCSPVAPARSSP